MSEYPTIAELKEKAESEPLIEDCGNGKYKLSYSGWCHGVNLLVDSGALSLDVFGDLSPSSDGTIDAPMRMMHLRSHIIDSAMLEAIDRWMKAKKSEIGDRKPNQEETYDLIVMAFISMHYKEAMKKLAS